MEPTIKIVIHGQGTKWDVINALKSMIQEVEEIPVDQVSGYVYEDSDRIVSIN